MMADEPELITKLKEHIRFEDGMDDSMLSFYQASAEKYVNKKIGHSEDYLTIMVATVMFDNRSATDELKAALNALEPIFALEVLTDDSEST